MTHRLMKYKVAPRPLKLILGEIQGSTTTPETDSRSRVVQSGPCFVSVLKTEDSTISTVIT